MVSRLYWLMSWGLFPPFLFLGKICIILELPAPWKFNKTGFYNSGPGFLCLCGKVLLFLFSSFIDLRLSLYSILKQRWSQMRVRSTYCWENTRKQNLMNELEFQLETKFWAISKLGLGRLGSWVERELHLRFSSLRELSQTGLKWC